MGKIKLFGLLALALFYNFAASEGIAADRSAIEDKVTSFRHQFFQALGQGDIITVRELLIKDPKLAKAERGKDGLSAVCCVIRSHPQHKKGRELLSILSKYEVNFNDHGAIYVKSSQEAFGVSPLADAILQFPMANDLIQDLIKSYQCNILEKSVDQALDVLGENSQNESDKIGQQAQEFVQKFRLMCFLSLQIKDKKDV